MNTTNIEEKDNINNHLIEQLIKLNNNINELDKNIKNMKNTNKPYDEFGVVTVCCLAIASMLFTIIH